MNILISGMTCSGKTTLSNEINDLYDASIIHQDDYFKDLIEIPNTKGYYLFDSPNAFHKEEFMRDVNIFLNTGSIFIPFYEIKSNKRLSKDIKVNIKDINIFEGLHTISLLKDIDSLKVFIDTDINECIKRRSKRDKVSEEKVKYYFEKVVIPLYQSYIEPQKKYSDIVISKESDKLCLLKKLDKYL